MNDPVKTAIQLLSQKFGGGFPHVVKFEIKDAGTVIMDSRGIREGGGEADCALIADAQTFKAIVTGESDPTAAYLSGILKIEGDLNIAVQLGEKLK